MNSINIDPKTIVLGIVASSITNTIIQYIYGIIDLIKNIFIKNMEINEFEHKEMFNMFLLYLKKNSIIIKSSKEIHGTVYQIVRESFGNKCIKQDDGYIFGNGIHYILYKKTLIKLNIFSNNNDYINNRKVCDISIIGSLDIIKKILEKLKDDIKKNNKLIVNAFTDSNGFSTSILKDKRTLDTVIIDENNKTKIYNDIKWFLNNREWYLSKGIHYHRGYLFYGLPGTGKTSLIMALASEFDMQITCASINDIKNVIKKSCNGTIIVFEDIDRSYINLEENGSKENGSKENFRELLQIMDGFDTPDNVIFILTANDITKIDPVIFRCGRIDLKIEFKSTDPIQAENMFLRFFPNEKDLAKKFGKEYKKIIGKDNCVPADIQEKLIEYVKTDNILGIFKN